MWHTGRVTPHNVEVSARICPRLGMPLDLCGARVQHGGREDGKNGGGGVQDSLLENGQVLADADR